MLNSYHNSSIGSLVFDRGDFLQTRTYGVHTEVLGTCCLGTFGDQLDKNLVGTPLFPVLHSRDPAASARLRWFSGLMVALQDVEGINRDLILALRELFDIDSNAQPTSPGAKAVALIRLDDDSIGTTVE